MIIECSVNARRSSDGCSLNGRRMFSEVQLTGAVQRHANDRALRFGT
jgi:hypothetical protein